MIEVSNGTAVSCLHPQRWNPDWGVAAWLTEVAGPVWSARSKGTQSLILSNYMDKIY
jgi:hypothetical protein